MTYCSLHPESLTARGKECVLCANTRMIADTTTRKERLLAKEAERKSFQEKNDIMNQKGKKRKPRAGGSGSSATE